MRYHLEQRIHTLAENVVDYATGGEPSFTADDLTGQVKRQPHSRHSTAPNPLFPSNTYMRLTILTV